MSHFWALCTHGHFFYCDFSCFSLSGYGIAASFSKLNRTLIAEIYPFVQTKLVNRLKAIDGGDNDTMTVDFFGAFYASTPNEFEFQPGDLCLIETLVAHVNQKVANFGYKYFKRRLNPSYKLLETTAIGRFFSSNLKHVENAEINSQTNNESQNNIQLLEKLRMKMSKDLKKLGCTENHMHKFNDNATVFIDESSGAVKASIVCAFCAEEDNPKTTVIKVYFDRTYWVLSNLNKHLNRFHMQSTSQTSQAEKTNESTASKEQKVIEPPTTTETNVLNPSHTLPNAGTSTSTVIENILVVHAGEDIDKVIENSIIEEDAAHEMNSEDENMTDINEDQIILNRKLQALYSMITEQAARMSELALQHNSTTETIALNDKEGNSIGHIDVCDVTPDGNCLFSSIAHQIFQHKIGSKQHESSTKRLRADVVKYIKQHLNDFVDILHDRVLDIRFIRENNTTKTAKSTDSKKIDVKKLVKVFLKQLASNGTWGGSESILAISKIFETNIIIFNENGSVSANVLNSLNFDFKKAVLIAYTHFGNSDQRNHYQSVCALNRDAILSSTQVLMEKTRNDNNMSVIDLVNTKM